MTLETAKDQNELINVFELKMHGSVITDTLKSNLLGMIEVELENLEQDEFDVLKIEVRRKTMKQIDYENLPEFDGY